MDLESKIELSNLLNHRFSRLRNINKKLDRFLLTIILLTIAFVGAALLDNLEFLDKGINGIKYHDFDELLAINPDTVAWITMDGTHIDHPVVQGKDNFEYLDKAFDGTFYAGGTLFLDYKNKKDFSDKYSIIHGHHMVGGAMFGDLDKYLDVKFFTENYSGTLLTPKYDYDLRVVAVGEYDAYDPHVYYVGDTVPSESILKKSTYFRRDELKKDSKVLALSTCSGDMTDDRIVVFCLVQNKRPHE